MWLRNGWSRKIIGLLLGLVGVLLIGWCSDRSSHPSMTATVAALIHPSTPVNQSPSSPTPLASLAQTSPSPHHPITPSPSPLPTTYQTIDEQRRNRFNVKGADVLAAATLPRANVNFNEADLLTVLQNTRSYFQTYSEENPDTQRAGILATQGVTVTDVLDTLDFMITTLEEDIAQQRPIRLKDPTFINTNFRVIRWRGYDPNYLDDEDIRLTKYAVFHHPGSRTRTATYTIPLYQLKADAETDRFYLNYTKQEVLSGIYEPGGEAAGRVEPLAYLTRDSFEDAIMQGTILINFTDGTDAYFNVDRNNGIAYRPGVSAYQQGRYWYFRPVDGIKGYGHKFEAKISIKPGVTFAGDVLNIGLGRIVVLEDLIGGQTQLQMGIIADTGGAFLPNLHQLDFLAGVFRDRDEFYTATRSLPEYAQAYFLIRKAR